MLSEPLNLLLPAFPTALGKQQRFPGRKFVAVQSRMGRDGKEAWGM